MRSLLNTRVSSLRRGCYLASFPALFLAVVYLSQISLEIGEDKNRSIANPALTSTSDPNANLLSLLSEASEDLRMRVSRGMRALQETRNATRCPARGTHEDTRGWSRCLKAKLEAFGCGECQHTRDGFPVVKRNRYRRCCCCTNGTYVGL